MNKNKKYLVVFGIFALVIVTTAASFAFFTYSRVGNTTTTITSGDIEFTYKEGEDVSLANAFPVADSVGANDTSEEYTFTVNLNSTSSANKMNYNVYLLDANDDANTNYFTNEQIKFALIKDGTFVAGTTGNTGKLLSQLAGFDEGKTFGEGLVLENQEITSGKTDEYKLRIWISDDVNYSNTSEISDGTDINNDAQTSIGKYNSYKYSLKVKVTSEIDTSTLIDLSTTGRIMDANLEDNNGLKYYAVTKSSLIPDEESTEWIEITNETSKNNVVKVTNNLIKNKTITYKTGNYTKYYLHVKNLLGKVTSKSFQTIKGEDYKDETGANNPMIASGMIPVIYSDGNWIKTDSTEKWYDYSTQWWANMVTVTNETRDKYNDADFGTTINMEDINTMWVWIPRFEYGNITATSAAEIKINFLNGIDSNVTTNYNTHPAFTFGTKELTGLWFAKFEASSDTACTAANGSVGKGCDVTSLNINIKPNVTSWRGIRVSTADLNSRAMNKSGNVYGFLESEVNTHMTKNMEWAAVAYLSQSIYGKYGNNSYTGANKEVYQNKSSSYITGMSNGTPSTSTTKTQVTYDVEGTGTGASSTGTIYGIYDMSGGTWEYVMGALKDNTSLGNPMSGNSDANNSGFTGRVYNSGNYKVFSGRDWPESKYYDLYAFGTTDLDNNAYNRYIKGDATKETKGWYGDYAGFVYANYNWFERSGGYSVSQHAGIFNIGRSHGGAVATHTFRPIITEQ